MSGRYGRGGPRGRSFGKAKPLPGQKGYGETESQRVEAQVAAMEARLAMMKVALTAEKQKMDQTAQKDGSRWKSGSVNAGSLTGYARDVQNRGRRKKRTKSGARGPSGRSRYTKQNFSNRGGKGPSARSGGGGAAQKTPRGGRENAEQWSPQEVGQWLQSIGLPQYQQVFADNAIDGAVLVEMGTEDLDYLNIKALGHRKMILGGLAEIRVDKSGGKPAATRTAASTQQEPPQKQPLKPKKHWAVAAAENQRRIDSQRDLPPVQTDGNIPLNQGTYDEAAQSALFQQSVMEWRKARAAAKAKESGGSDNNAGTAVATNAAIDAGKALDGGGSLLQGRYDEAEQSRLFQQSVMQWRKDRARAASGQAPDNSQWVNPFGTGEEDEIQHPPAHKDGGKLLKGEFNESEEHEKFREAVLNWRKNGGKGAGSPSRRSSCWQCFKVLSSASTNLQFDGKNICSEACLSQAQKAKALRTERKAEVTSPIRKGADTAAAKQIFEASPSREQAKQETATPEVRYTGEDLSNLLDTEAWKVSVDY